MALTTLKRGRKPRNRNQIFELITLAQRIYLETGGADIDHQIKAAKRQLERCEHYANHPPLGEQAKALSLVNAALRELRTAEQMREKKLAECTKLVEEAQQSEIDAQDQASPKPTPAPDTPPPKPDQPAATASPEDRHDQSDS
ncbi:MAG: hypothetical protein H6839_10885 [Planctomycetes bacterium]|nr:hypothetical protein [Planctomycetota bacterium]